MGIEEKPEAAMDDSTQRKYSRNGIKWSIKDWGDGSGGERDWRGRKGASAAEQSAEETGFETGLLFTLMMGCGWYTLKDGEK